MSKTISSLLFKLLLTFIAGWLAFGFMEGNMFTWLLLLAVVFSVLNYIVGDMLLLPRAGNIISALVDGFMAAIIAYVVDMLSDTFKTTFVALLIFGLIITLSEILFHRYLVKDNEIYSR